MTGQYRLYIVTENPHYAAHYFFLCDRPGVPAWAKICSTFEEIKQIPSGSHATSVWFSNAPDLEWCWRIHRRQHGIACDHAEILDEIRTWLAKKAETAMQPAIQPEVILAPVAQQEPEPDQQKPSAAPAPPPAKPAMQKPPAPRWT